MTDERRHSWSRRRFLVITSAAAGVAALAACGGSSATEAPKASGSTPAATAASTTAATMGPATSGATAAVPSAAAPAIGAITLPTGDAKNPLTVKEDAPLDVVIFKGGYGDDYALNVNKIYQAAFPKAKIAYQGIQQLGNQLQPRFVGGNPPDIIDNSGAGNLDNAALVAEGQLAELQDLWDAPSFDTPGKKVSETILAGSQEPGKFDNKMFVLNYVLSVNGIWYSDATMKKNGWEYPKTWDAMLALCEKIKGTGVAPWTYQGKYPQYMRAVMDDMIYKAGGIDPILKLDNLEPNAWKQPEVKTALEALYQLADKGYIMQGTEGLTHTEAQAEWLKGKAVFIPCGSWLENEEKGLIPDGFNMTVASVPSLPNDKIPFEGIDSAAGEGFLVPSKGKNVPGGKEYLRMLFSKQGARFFSQNTKSLTVVQGAADGLELGTAFASVNKLIQAAGKNTYSGTKYAGWYKALDDESKNQMGALLTKQIKVDDYIAKVQKVADDIAKDSSVKKFKRIA
ncbi:MAG: N-acetylglucosamine/diacetylchitobiose ABC transporter substrate-binding protein [Thermomicrobiales bacterium]